MNYEEEVKKMYPDAVIYKLPDPYIGYGVKRGDIKFGTGIDESSAWSSAWRNIDYKSEVLKIHPTAEVKGEWDTFRGDSWWCEVDGMRITDAFCFLPHQAWRAAYNKLKPEVKTITSTDDFKGFM